ncbi:MAG TPA: PepSY-associated TM helix domain-containing protein [Chthoniobacteraceae bacterium]|nr:PepSY-associated TM helix domain-containing protein [Chthoniobacteraceae bacterium]
MRRFHRWLGLGSTLVILLAVTTGLLWAYAPYLYWQGGYMERKHPVAPASYDGLPTFQDALRIVRERVGQGAVITTVTLRTDAGIALYEVTGTREGKGFMILLEARTGAVLSPLTPEFAERIARQYVEGEPSVESAALLEPFVHRSGKSHPSVYRVRFRAPKTPEIFIAADSGRILEEQDDVRRFHFWVMRLHQLNFFGFRKTLTIIPGTALLLLLGSGLVISRRKRSKARREKTPGLKG